MTPVVVAIVALLLNQSADFGPRGVIRDQTGAVLQGARVELLDSHGDIVETTAADPTGAFQFRAVLPGSYIVRVEVQGFRESRTTVRVAARRAPPPLNVVLDLAAVPQDITVNAQDDVIAAAAASNRDAISVDSADLRNLPVFDRDIVATLSRFLDASAFGSSGVTLVVDGMEARKVGVSPSAIQQIKVNQDPYSAEFPRPGRGRIEVVTKAGAEAYEGSFNFTFRDDSLNARDPFAVTKPPEQRRIYEGVLGGPIAGGEHTSFLFTIERRDEDLQSIVYAAGPSGTITANVARPDRGTEVSASINHQQGKNHTLFARVTSEVANNKNQGVGGTTLPEAGTDGHGDEEQVIVGARSILTPKVLSEFRLLLGREIGWTRSLTPGVRIVVLDAFTGGGAQADEQTTEYHFNLTENLTYVHGRHLIKGGFAIPDFSRRGFDDRTNRAGTFTFSTLDDYARGTPFSFLQQRGDGRLVFLQKVFGAFIQDQIAMSDRLSITPGLRYDWQNIFVDNNNVAPRVSAAFAVDKKTVIRGGAGLFYDRAGDGAIHDVLRSRENRLQRYIILDPGYPDAFGGFPAADEPSSIVVISPAIRTPYTVQFGAGVERQIRKGTTIAVTYLGSHGSHLFRSRDVNAPLPPAYEIRPNAAYGQIRQIESAGRQNVHSLQLLARGRIIKSLQGNIQYTLSSARNDTGGINWVPANSYDLSGEYARADVDQRHRLEAMVQTTIAPRTSLGLAVSLASGRPYTLRTGTDDFHTGQTNARPAGVGRNTLDGPDYASVDARLSHEFALGGSKPGEGPGLAFGVEAFNIFNHVNYVGYVGNLRSPFFGQAIAAQPPRRIQLSAEVHF
jgi:outer membrane receptor protein involved in Fe transport